MSIYSNQTWAGACMSANQSPINLSQSSAKPCNLSCSFSFDDTSGVIRPYLRISDEGLIMGGPATQLGSCKFRDETYTCDAILVNHPSHHTLEGVQADGEVIAVFGKPTGERLMVSSLFHVNPNETPSSNFFKQFVPYAQVNTVATAPLSGWSLNQMGSGGYYVYSGSSVVPPCLPCEWVVFKTMINIDPTDFAFLVRNVQAGSRNIQGIGNRDVFYNDQGASGVLPHDNKTYLVMRPLKGNTMKKPNPVKAVDLKTEQNKLNAAQVNDNSTTKTITKHMSEHPWEWLANIIVLISTVLAIYLGYTNYIKADGTLSFPLFNWLKNTAIRWRTPLPP